MTAEAFAVWGLVLWVWSHERQHAHEKTGSRDALVVAAIAAVGSGVLLTLALLRALGWAV